MKNPSNIAHPLKNRPGTSQKNRLIQALESKAAPIDGKTLADRLYLISLYARQINFYQYKNTESNGESQKLDSWSLFFKDSLPFQLAILSKLPIEELDAQFSLLYEELKANPSKQSLELLFNFVFSKIITPTTLLFKMVQKEENSFSEPLLAILKTAFSESLKSFICLYNASVNFLCISKKNFSDFLGTPWQLKVDDIYAIDLCIQQVKKGKKEAFLIAAEVLNTLFQQVLSGMQSIVIAAPDYISESLTPLKESLQKKHEPHLALLFAFLELFEHFQGNINELTKKHLDFFYEEVLKIIPKDAVPDQAHIIFEIAKHQQQYLLKKDLLLKDGKDNNKQDIQFGLAHELVLDKAQIKELRTLSVHPIMADDVTYIEGVYMAPVATMADGQEKDFKDGEPKNWPTLGSKYSKYISEGSEIPEQYPIARLGFALASPVLLLEEGKRVIQIRLNCNLPASSTLIAQEIKDALDEISTQEIFYFDAPILEACSGNLTAETLAYLYSLLDKNGVYEIGYDLKAFLTQKDPISCLPLFNEQERTALCECLINEKKSLDDQHLFTISFSGEKEWVIPKSVNIETVAINLPVFPPTPGLSNEGDLQFMFKITLDDDDPKVVFFNAEKLKEEIQIKTPFPIVKIELNPKIKKVKHTFLCDKLNGAPPSNEDKNNKKCCLKKEQKPLEEIEISPYHFLKGLTLQDAHINVEVCGVKNLIVQNDENLQDVNKPMFPFGPRPKVDAAFVIGSKEVFCKNWQSFRLGVEWKDRPVDFEDYYEAYNQNDNVNITNAVFEIEGGILDEGNWQEENGPIKKLFEPKDAFPPCSPINLDFNYNGYTWDRANFPISPYDVKSMPFEPLTPLKVNSRKAFFRIKLKNEDFQHDSYAFVLAQQMFKLSQVADLIKVQSVINRIVENHDLSLLNLNRINDLINEMNIAGGSGGVITAQMVLDIFGRVLPLPVVEGLDSIAPNLHTIAHDLRDDVLEITGGNDAPVIPNEPYTPTLKSIYLDYHAIATKEDMDIIHLYPYENTSKLENIEAGSTLFPYFNDEGTLFIGLENVTAGGSLSILFQLAEATADSELDRAQINWHYLRNNKWEPLQFDFDIISDKTDGFTVSGIATIAVPNDINNSGNTLMPNTYYWIKVSAPENVRAVAETIGIHTQAAATTARFSALSDKKRLEKGLAPGSIAKLVEGDFNVKKIEQLYPSFGGKTPEANGHFYTRVSEHLKHKGRAALLHDYEKIVLEEFPEIYKVKCISHTMGLSAIEYRRDLEIAPGFVVVTVIPDLTKLEAGNLKEPKAPVSLLEKIGNHIRKRTSPFARLKVMNPRFEYVHVAITVRLYRGKSESFYTQKLKEELHLFLAPWSLGDSEKLTFGQAVLFSDIVGFVEKLEYVDFIAHLELKGECEQTGAIIKPLTARSVLTGGNVCVVNDKEECVGTEKCIEDEEPIALI